VDWPYGVRAWMETVGFIDFVANGAMGKEMMG